jgi:hypothetical protein
MIGFVAHQLGLSSADFADYAQRDQTRREYAVKLQRYMGLRRRARPVCLSLRADACESHHRKGFAAKHHGDLAERQR